MSDIDLSFSGARFESGRLSDRYDLLLGVVAEFTLASGGIPIFEEPEFPVVELRVELDRWLAVGLANRQAFELESLETEEKGLAWFRPTSDALWQIGSLYQEAELNEEWPLETLVTACGAFIAAVDQWVADSLQIEVRRFLQL